MIETPLLTTPQRDRLITREEKKGTELDAYKKRHNDQVVLKKFGDYIESLPDVLLILKHMPPEKITPKLKQEHIPLVLDLAEEFLERLDPWPIGEHENGKLWAFKTYGDKFPNCEPGKCGIQTVSRTAFEKDVELHQRLKSHLGRLRLYIDPCVPDPICRDPQYAMKLYDKTLQDAKELSSMTGEPFSGKSDSYFDEYLVEGSSWVHRKPSVVDIDQLKAMRWKPRGLKECMELPPLPLFGEKKIPRGPEIMHGRIECNAEGIRYLISERGEEERAVTKEEYLELSEKYGMIKKAAETSHQSSLDQEEPK